MKKYVFIPLTALALMFISSCNSTKIISSWSASNPPSYSLNKMLVLAVMTDREVLDKTEHAMVAELRANGVNAYSAFDLFGPKRFNGLTETEIFSRLKDSDYTSVMIVSLLDKDKETRYVPGSYYYPPYYPGYMHFYRRYWNIYGSVYTPGYYTTTTKYILGADIYTLNDDDDDLIYSAQTRSYNPTNIQGLAKSFSQSIVQGLREKGVLK